VAANLLAVREAAGRAAAQGADLVVFPEAFITGYNIGERLGELAEPADGPSVTALREIASEAGVAVLCGYPERDGPLVHNAAVPVDARGEPILGYRKTHLFGPVDHAAFAPGDSFAVAELAGLRVGVLICFDIEFPQAARRLALLGAQLIVVPTSLMAPFDVVARTLVPARAAENQVFVAYANRVKSEGDLLYVGQSCVCGPDGNDLARAGGEEAALIVAELDPRAVERARGDCSYLDGRRPELYRPLAADPVAAG
jgi:predicted amidohydrolase